jgi:SAM-dependent methyltransferase
VSGQPLTDADHWDSYWEHGRKLPVDVDRDTHSSTEAILGVMDRFVPSGASRSVLEIGGAPGGFLAHFQRKFGHAVCVLDNSPVGIEMTRRNFELLGISGEVLQHDMFDATACKPQFDVVYSHGLIEHFADTRSAIAAHLAYLKPGGTLIVGCPNFLGVVNRLLIKRLSPSLLGWHELAVMDIRRWPEFERELRLRVRFRGYIAGFQPGAFWRRESRSVTDRALHRGLIELGRLRDKPFAAGMSKINSRHWSYYALGVYENRADAGR